MIREKLGLRVGQRVEFELNARGEVTLTPRICDVRSLRASIRSPLRRRVRLKEMDSAIAGGASGFTVLS